MQIRQASTDDDFRIVRCLFQEYAAQLRIDLCFQWFAEELAGLPGQYAPPKGQLLIAGPNSGPAGCVALRPREGRICEMKRLFVKPVFQGQGVGRRLAERVIAEARTIGYSKMVLDTLPPMLAAIRLL